MDGKTVGIIGFISSIVGIISWLGITPEMFGSVVYNAIHAALPFWMLAGGFAIGWFVKGNADSMTSVFSIATLTKDEAMAIVKIIDDGGTTSIDHAWEENVLILDGERDPQDKLFETTWTSGGRCSSDTYRLNAKTARAVAGKSTRRKIRKIAESD